MTVDERYRTDGQFNALVTMLEQLLHKAQFTPTELREAVIYAQIRYECRHPRPILFSPEMREFFKKEIERAPSVPKGEF